MIKDNMSLIEMSEYMLVEVRKENINNIYNNSNVIYFDKNCMYLEYN